MQQGFHGPVLGHRHREAGGGEAGLAHPAGHHRSAELAVAAAFQGGEYAQGAHDAAQGQHGRIAAALAEAAAAGTPLGLALLALQLAPQSGAGFLDGLEGRGIGAEFHLDRLKGEAEAAIAQLALEQIEGLTTPAEAAEHPHRLAPITFSEQGAQS